MTATCPTIDISAGPDNCLQIKIEGASDDFSPFPLALTLAEREMGMEMGRMIGHSGSKEWSRYTLQVERGKAEAWRDVLLRRLLQPAEEAYLERGAVANEPSFSHLDVRSPDRMLRDWVLQYYAANGITDGDSLGEIHGCDRAYYVVLKASLLKRDLAARDYVNDVSARAYARFLENGGKLPPLVIRRSYNRYHVLEGFHRLHAYARIGQLQIPCIVLGRNLPSRPSLSL